MKQTERGQAALWVVITMVVVALILLATSFYIVPAGSVGVITHWGAVKYVVQPGLGMKWPISEGIVKMSVRTQKDEVVGDKTSGAVSKDLQLVTFDIAVNYHLDGQHAVDVYQKIGTGYKDTVVSPAILNVFKAITAQHTAEELVTMRNQVRTDAETMLAAQMKPYYVVIDNFNIVNFDFSDEFNAAIEAKQVAQQQVETSKQLLAKAQVDAQTAVAQAKGQADAQAALKNTGALTPEYLSYLALQNQLVALNKWNGILPGVTGGAVPFIDVANYASSTSTPTTK